MESSSFLSFWGFIFMCISVVLIEHHVRIVIDLLCVEWIVIFPSIYHLWISWIPISIVVAVLKLVSFRFASFLESKGALDLCSLIIFMGESLRFSRFIMFLLEFRWCLRFEGKRTNVNARSCRSTKVDESKVCDIPAVYTKSNDEHGSHLKMNLELLKKEKCYVKPNKAWWFCLRMLEALGVRDEECDLDGSRESTTHFQSEGLNMRQRRWMELFSDYGCETKYHIGKANIVVDAWRRKGGVKPKRVRDICRMIQAEISENMLV
nr:putative reverse transcriptase domain-containing protein [Tanacetum cinerariifolium]